jgi:hypothetical protein
MTDVNTYYGYPAGYNAGAIFADAPGCNGSSTPYYPTSVENEAVTWIDDGYQTVIMLDMASGCSTSISAYETLAGDISSNISGRVSSADWDRYFYGFMVDEEPQFWTSASAAATDYTDFNGWLELNEPNFPLAEVGNSPGYWTQAQYNDVAWEYSWSAPQVYNTRTEDNQNNLVNDDGGYYTLVTCYPGQYSSPFDTCSDAASVIDGSPWTYSTWGSGNWYNQFQPA